MEYFIRGKQLMVMWLAEHHRRTLCLMQKARHSTVRAYLQQGVRPHISLYGVRYTSRILAANAQLIGKRLLIYLNSDDLRSVRAFLPDGAELGILDAQGGWNVMPHNLKLRQEILAVRGRRRSPSTIDSNPIEAYLQQKLAQAKYTKRAANELAQAIRILGSAPSVRTPMGPIRPATGEPQSPMLAAAPEMPPVSPCEKSVTRSPVRVRKLSIGPGQVF
jgi:hypothetical protein